MNQIWVVLEPRESSTIADVAYETTAERFALSVLGGLDPRNSKPAFHANAVEAFADLARRCEAKQSAFALLGLHAQDRMHKAVDETAAPEDK